MLVIGVVGWFSVRSLRMNCDSVQPPTISWGWWRFYGIMGVLMKISLDRFYEQWLLRCILIMGVVLFGVLCIWFIQT